MIDCSKQYDQDPITKAPMNGAFAVKHYRLLMLFYDLYVLYESDLLSHNQ